MMHWGWSQFFGWKFSQLGTYLFWTLHLCRYQCPPPGPREFVMHFNSRRQIIAVLVKVRHKIWVAYKAKSAPLPKNWLEASTAHGTMFTSSPRSQHSGSRKSSHLRNASNVSALVVNILWKGDLWYVEFFTNMLYNFQVINALQKPTPNWTNLWRNVRNFSKLSEMSQKFNDSEVGWYIW